MDKKELLKQIFEEYGYRYSYHAGMRCSDSEASALGALYKREDDNDYENENTNPMINHIILTRNGIYPWYDDDYVWTASQRAEIKIRFGLIRLIEQLVRIL